jgi:small basic protein
LNLPSSQRLSFLEQTRVDIRARKAGIPLSPRQRIAAHAVTLVRGTALVEALAGVATIMSIFAGIRIAMETRPDPQSFTNSYYHPYVAVGIIIAIVSLWLGIAVALLARTLRIYAERSIEHYQPLEDA